MAVAKNRLGGVVAGAAFLGVLLAGCSGTPSAAHGTPISTTAIAPQAAAAPAQVTTPPPPHSTPAAATRYLLGPTGYGGLKLGATFADARRLGFVRATKEQDGCYPYPLYVGAKWSGYVNISPTRGVEAINPTAAPETAEGIKIGSSLAKTKKAYPDLNSEMVEQLGRVHVAVPGNRNAVYRLAIVKGAVQDITLQFGDQDCYE